MWVIIYFVILIIIGAYFLLKLMLAVIKSKFTEEHKARTKNKELDKNKQKQIKIIESEASEDLFKELHLSQLQEGGEDTTKKQMMIINQIRVNTLLKRVDVTLK